MARPMLGCIGKTGATTLPRPTISAKPIVGCRTQPRPQNRKQHGGKDDAGQIVCGSSDDVLAGDHRRRRDPFVAKAPAQQVAELD